MPEPLAPLPLPAGTGLQFDKVTFAWPGRAPVLEGLSLDIPAGARVAILGPSGSGKSTLAALALKVVAPQSGAVLLGGTDLAGLAAADVHAPHGVAQPDHDAVRGHGPRQSAARPARTRTTPSCGARSTRRGSPRWCAGLPDGLDTWLGTGGAGLSGGQGRRLALARALLSRAPILILDEPATGLDAAAERAFFETLNEAATGQTVILIVHRLTGVERLDRIWRLSGGRAVAAAG